MQTSDQLVPPVLVLGLGNVLLGDDGVGPALLREVQALYAGVPAVECIDGGTQGMALLAYLGGREALIILDAFAGGRRTGAVSILEGPEVLGCEVTRSTTAHEGNAGELLAIAQLLDELPERVFLVGIEPERVRTELGLSECVASAIPAALVRTCGVVERVLAELSNTDGRLKFLACAVSTAGPRSQSEDSNARDQRKKGKRQRAAIRIHA